MENKKENVQLYIYEFRLDRKNPDKSYYRKYVESAVVKNDEIIVDENPVNSIQYDLLDTFMKYMCTSYRCHSEIKVYKYDNKNIFNIPMNDDSSDSYLDGKYNYVIFSLNPDLNCEEIIKKYYDTSVDYFKQEIGKDIDHFNKALDCEPDKMFYDICYDFINKKCYIDKRRCQDNFKPIVQLDKVIWEYSVRRTTNTLHIYTFNDKIDYHSMFKKYLEDTKNYVSKLILKEQNDLLKSLDNEEK